jgi:hypothetical protein
MKSPSPLVILVVVLVVAAGCDGRRTAARPTTTLHASFTSVADSICEQAPRWHGRPHTPAQSNRYAHYVTATMTALAAHLARLTPPPGQRKPFMRMLAAMRDIAVAFSRSLSANARRIRRINAGIDRDTRIIDVTAHKLQLYDCVAR